MIIVTIINIISVFLTYISTKKRYYSGFMVSIIILILFYGIRFNYGNDYPQYLTIFQSINSITNIDYSTDSTELEWGWKFLNRIFQPLGFFSFVFFLTLIQFVTIYKLIKKYVDPKYWHLALFSYLFSSGLMLTMLSMMRQCLAMNIIIWAIPYILNKKIWKSLFIITLAAQFHQSAYLMMILPFTIYLYKIPKKLYIILTLTIFIFSFIAHDFISTVTSSLLSNNFEKYEVYIEEQSKLEIGSGIGMIFNFLFMLFLIFTDQHKLSPTSWFFKMLTISYLLIPISFITPQFGRIATYFNLLGILSITTIAQNSKHNIYIAIFFFTYIFLILYGYFTFFHSPIWIEHYLQYHTIFESLTYL